MPFPLNETTTKGDALKAYEYLAGGRPVVSTPVPTMLEMTIKVAVARPKAGGASLAGPEVRTGLFTPGSVQSGGGRSRCLWKSTRWPFSTACEATVEPGV